MNADEKRMAECCTSCAQDIIKSKESQIAKLENAANLLGAGLEQAQNTRDAYKRERDELQVRNDNQTKLVAEYRVAAEKAQKALVDYKLTYPPFYPGAVLPTEMKLMGWSSQELAALNVFRNANFAPFRDNLAFVNEMIELKDRNKRQSGTIREAWAKIDDLAAKVDSGNRTITELTRALEIETTVRKRLESEVAHLKANPLCTFIVPGPGEMLADAKVVPLYDQVPKGYGIVVAKLPR